MPASAVDVVRIAFDHTAEQLFKPFRLGQWTRLAVVGLLAGEMTSGGCSPQMFGFSNRSRGSQNFLMQALPPGPVLVAAIALLVLAGLLFLIAWIYISSVMRFVLLDSIVAKECHIRRFWSQRQAVGFRYFLWQMLFTLVTVSGIATLAMTAFVLAFGFGWLRDPRSHLLPLILVGAIFFVAFAVFIIIALIISVLTKDFVVPQMALENIGALEAWRRLLTMMQQEQRAYLGYVGLKILLSLGALAAMGVAALIAIVAWALPVGILGVATFLAARAFGLGWNIITIAGAAVLGCVALVALLYVLLLVSVPVIVFFPAYSVHFFAERYPPLSRVI